MRTPVAGLNFGYSQTMETPNSWCWKHGRGLSARIYRPSLVSASRL